MLPYLQILAWPVTVVVVTLVLYPVLRPLLAKSKVKVELFGVTIETDLATLEAAMTESIGGVITEDERHYLERLMDVSEKHYPHGVPEEEREFLRPLRNAALIMTVPRGYAFAKAKFIRITKLGRLVMKGKAEKKSPEKRSPDGPER